MEHSYANYHEEYITNIFRLLLLLSDYVRQHHFYQNHDHQTNIQMELIDIYNL